MHHVVADHSQYEVTREGKMKPQSTKPITKKGAFWAPLFLSAALAGCMQDPGSPTPGGTSELPSDNGVAGASSSTNWPEKHAYEDDELRGSADSTLKLRFFRQSTPVSIGGKIVFFKSGTISALQPVDSLVWTFPETDSLTIPLDLLKDSLGTSDTISFSMRVEEDSGQCLLDGFRYSFSQKKFSRNHFSDFPEETYFLVKPEYYYIGSTDSLVANLPTVNGNSQTSFYIAGTPYYWKTGLTSEIRLGPIPRGNHHIRLMRVSDASGNGSQGKVELFEIIFTITRHDTPAGILFSQDFHLGSTLWTGDVSPSPQLRD
jgi:hypothetical protein